MIGFIHGVCLHEANGVATFAVGNVGYEVHVFDVPRVYSDGDLTNGLGASEIWWIHEHAPQDAPHELYGFYRREQRDLFRRLLDIKGVGPKVAMRIVGSGIHGQTFSEPGEFASRLTKIRGVGATLAERICEAFNG